jgi:hypothetical protein
MNLPVNSLGPELSLALIRDTWGAEVPSDAQQIELSSDGAPHIWLRFRASPETVSLFTDGICNGILHDGYDPFNALSSEEPQPNSFLIKLTNIIYYSHSLETSKAVWGNRCIPTPGGATQFHQIQVDRSNLELYTVRFEQVGSNCFTRGNLPVCRARGAAYVTPINNYPLMIVGLKEVNDGYILLGNELCVDTLLTYPARLSIWQEKWNYLDSAQVEIEVDGESFPTGVISSSNHRLIPLSVMNTNLFDRNDIFWNYCLKSEWVHGNHTLHVTINPVEGNQEVYWVEFLVE